MLTKAQTTLNNSCQAAAKKDKLLQNLASLAVTFGIVHGICRCTGNFDEALLGCLWYETVQVCLVNKFDAKERPWVVVVFLHPGLKMGSV